MNKGSLKCALKDPTKHRYSLKVYMETLFKVIHYETLHGFPRSIVKECAVVNIFGHEYDLQIKSRRHNETDIFIKDLQKYFKYPLLPTQEEIILFGIEHDYEYKPLGITSEDLETDNSRLLEGSSNLVAKEILKSKFNCLHKSAPPSDCQNFILYIDKERFFKLTLLERLGCLDSFSEVVVLNQEHLNVATLN